MESNNTAPSSVPVVRAVEPETPAPPTSRKMKESELPSVNLADVQEFRVISKNGESRKMSVEQTKIAILGGLEVGGRNYVRDSRELISISDSLTHSFKIKQVTNVETNVDYMLTANVAVTRGDITTVSIAFSSSLVNATLTGLRLFDVIDGKIKGVMRGVDIQCMNYILFYNGTVGLTDNDIVFTNIKLEKGTIATDWTPAPEDIAYNITPSTTEQATGEIFEGKPVYVRLIKGSVSAPNAAGTTVISLMHGIDKAQLVLMSTTDIHGYDNANKGFVQVSPVGVAEFIIIGGVYTGKPFTLIVKYTKL